MNSPFDLATSLENRRRDLQDLINRLWKEHDFEDDPKRKMRLEQDIREAEEKLAAVSEQIREAYDIDTPSGQTILEKEIKELNIEQHLGRLYLVNCDRSEMYDAFWNRYGDFSAKKQHFQFYFITSCNTQMPQRFSERMAYELIELECDSDDNAVKADWKESPGGERLLRVEDIPFIPRDLESSKKEFKKAFAKRFEFKEPESFEDFLKTGVPQIGQKFVITLYSIPQAVWGKSFFPEYLDWIMKSFSQTHENVPLFLFYFSFYLKGMHENVTEEHNSLLAVLDKLAREYPNACLLKPLLPVPQEDIDEWLRSLGEDSPGIREKILKVYLKGFDRKNQDRFNKLGVMDMDPVMSLQKLIYNWYHRKNSSSSL